MRREARGSERASRRRERARGSEGKRPGDGRAGAPGPPPGRREVLRHPARGPPLACQAGSSPLLPESRRGLVGGSTFRRTPISRSPLDKNPMPGHLSELQPVNEVNTKGQFFRASFGKKPQVPKTARQAASLPGDISRGKRSSMPQPKSRPDSPVPSLQGPCDRSLKSEVPCGSCLNWR